MNNDVENLHQETQVLQESGTTEVSLNKAVDIDQAIAQQTKTQELQTQQSEKSEAVENNAQSEQEGFQARNFRELKEIARRERAEKEALAKQVAEMKKIYEQQAQQQQPVQPIEDDFDIEIGNDDIAEGKHLKKVKSAAQKALQEQKRLKAEIEALRVEREIERELPDFYKVVTTDNVQAFAMMEPDLARVISSYPDLKSAAKATYSAIVKAGIHKMHEYDTQKELIKQNMSKPKTISEVAQTGGTSPISRAADAFSGDLTDEMKKMYYQEMKRAQRGR